MLLADFYRSIKDWLPPLDAPRVPHSREERYLLSLALMNERLYQSRDLTRIDFSGQLKYLINRVLGPIISEQGAVRIGLESDGVMMDIDTAVLCGALIHELLLQAIFRVDGISAEIRVELALDDKARYRLFVHDTGIGLSSFFDSEGPGAGENLIGMLVDQLCGQMDVRGGEGTAVYIVFTGPRS